MKKRPKTGEKRQVRQPFKADSLPQEKRDEVLRLRAEGKSWEAISRAVGVPKSSLHRWYDVRVEQVKQEVLKESEWARGVAEAFTRNGYERLPDAVKNALADQVFGLLQAADAPGSEKMQAALLGFMDQLTKLKRVEVQQEKVENDKRKLALMEQQVELMRSKLRGLGRDLSKRKVTPQEIKAKIDEIYGITA